MGAAGASRPFAVLTAALLVASCAPGIPKDALVLTPESLQDRQVQTRVFETADEEKILTASAAVLQDLGFTIEESETPCGLIVCSRDRDVSSTGKVIGSIFLAVLAGQPVYWDKHQKVVASLVTRPVGETRIAVRVTFQHMVWNTNNQLTKNEAIRDPEIYQEFFERLSKSVFLTAHDI